MLFELIHVWPETTLIKYANFPGFFFHLLENGKAVERFTTVTALVTGTLVIYCCALVTENEEERFRLNSSPYAGGEQQSVDGEDGNANQQADYK
ncbi:hypothetical protein T4D_15258 [Trichinella pseudospiralis]|uniref:Uncharacterized protein n=1 Tax=Trichinella pseudospiralis TaxID=6337 RepID=A0A0V1FG17_TRIPS|nr:hypothetical protein T4D_15258 [Trichinella pseudospiralis]